MEKFKELWNAIYEDGNKKKTALIESINAEGFIEVKEAIALLMLVGKYEVGLNDANYIFERIFKETTAAAPTFAEGIE